MTDFIVDTFTAANGTDLDGRSPDTGSAWSTTGPGLMAIQTNELQGPYAGDSYAYNPTTPPGADYYVSANLHLVDDTLGNFAGVYGRISGIPSPNGYMAMFDTAVHEWQLYAISGYSFGLLDSVADLGFTSGTKRIELGMVGSSISLAVDGVVLLTATDTNESAAQHAGIIMHGGYPDAMMIDQFKASDVAGAPVSTTISGRGQLALTNLGYVLIDFGDLSTTASTGTAEPPNYFHVAMLAFGSASGWFTAFPATRELELIKVPDGATLLGYNLASGVSADVYELSSP